MSNGREAGDNPRGSLRNELGDGRTLGGSLRARRSRLRETTWLLAHGQRLLLRSLDVPCGQLMVILGRVEISCIARLPRQCKILDS